MDQLMILGLVSVSVNTYFGGAFRAVAHSRED